LDQGIVYGVLSGGTIVSLLLFGLFRSLLNIQARKQKDIALKQAHEELEQRVAVRTEELRRANEFLQAEIIERKRSDEAVRNSLREKESLLKEIHHRVKNNLQIVSSLLRLQSAQIDNPIGKAAMQDMQNRVRSMAIIHEHLYRSENFSQVDMSAYIQTLCHKLMQAMVVRPDAILLHLDMVPVHLEIDQAIPCGLLLNELVCNSFKHAFPQGRKGEVRVELRPVDEGRQIHLRVSDNGVGLPADFDIKHLNSLGLELASDLASQIRGRLEIGPGPGATFDVVFTLGNRMESTRKSGDTEMRRKENA
jgi:two-component sensor histidine kinase